MRSLKNLISLVHDQDDVLLFNGSQLITFQNLGFALVVFVGRFGCFVGRNLSCDVMFIKQCQFPRPIVSFWLGTSHSSDFQRLVEQICRPRSAFGLVSFRSTIFCVRQCQTTMETTLCPSTDDPFFGC